MNIAASERMAALANRLRALEEECGDDRAKAVMLEELRFLATDIETGDFDTALAASYNAFWEDGRTFYQTAEAEREVIAEFCRDGLGNLDDFLEAVVDRASKKKRPEDEVAFIDGEDK